MTTTWIRTPGMHPVEQERMAEEEAAFAAYAADQQEYAAGIDETNYLDWCERADLDPASEETREAYDDMLVTEAEQRVEEAMGL